MDAKDLAIKLHDKFCTANHVDACEWGYEKNMMKTMRLKVMTGVALLITDGLKKPKPS